MTHIEQIPPLLSALPESFLATALLSGAGRLRLSGVAKSSADAAIARIQRRLEAHNVVDFSQFIEVLRQGSVEPKEIDEILHECASLSRILEHAAAPVDWTNLSQVAYVEMSHAVRDMMGTRVDGTVVANVRIPESGRECPACIDPVSGEQRIAAHLADCMVIGVAPDDRLILKFRGSQEEKIKLWDPVEETFSPVAGLHGFGTMYSGFSQSLFELFDETVHIVNIARRAFPRSIHLDRKYKTLIGRTQDATFIGIRKDDETVIDAIDTSGKTSASFKHRIRGAGYTHVSVVGGGAVIRADGNIWYWDLSRKGKKTLLVDVDDKATMGVSAVIHPRLPHLLALTYRAVSHETSIDIFDIRSGEKVASYPANVLTLSTHANGKLLVRGDKSIAVWE